MSRGRKKIEPEVTEEIAVASTDDVVVEEEPVMDLKETVVEEEPAVQTPTNVNKKKEAIEWATQYIGEHSRRRPGSVSGMMPTAYRLTIAGGRVRFFNLPMNVEECAVEESWKRCKPYMTPEEFIAFLTRVVGIAPPPLYSVFRVINIE